MVEEQARLETACEVVRLVDRRSEAVNLEVVVELDVVNSKLEAASSVVLATEAVVVVEVLACLVS